MKNRKGTFNFKAVVILQGILFVLIFASKISL